MILDQGTGKAPTGNGFLDWFFNPSLESQNAKKIIDSANGGKETPATVESPSYASQISDFVSNKDNWLVIAIGAVIVLLIAKD
jgi:hypothetical protein